MEIDLQKQLDSFIINEFEKNLDFLGGEIFTKLRESETIEFKKSLHKTSEGVNKDYLRTIAGFSNNNGGYIVFGIDPDSFQLTGIKPELKDFDNRFFSTTINKGFDGNVEAFFKTKEYSSKIIGFLFTKKAIHKPIILTHTISSEVVEGDIMYRYPGQTKRIHSSDLRKIITVEIQNQTSKLLKQIDQIAKIGIENSAILNTLNGEITTDKANVRLVLDHSILNTLNLIPEANIVDSDASPAYIIKGDLYTENATIIERTVSKTFKSNDLYSAFIDQKCSSPQEYIKNILFQNSHYYPIYFFVSLTKSDNAEIIKFLTSIHESDVKKSVKDSLIKKIKNNIKEKPLASIIPDLKIGKINLDELKTTLSEIKTRNGLKGNNRDVTIIRTIIYSYLSSKKEIPEFFITKNTRETIEAITHLEKEQIKKNQVYVFDVAKKLLKEVEDQENLTSLVKYSFKKMLCFLDQSLYN